MLALIQGSNRRGNATTAVVRALADRLATGGREVRTVDLVGLPADVLHADMYASGVEHAWLAGAEATLKAADGWLFAFPEYNGSYPGALKLFVDALSVRDYEGLFGGRVAALVGTASGRSGNVKGMEHFTSILQYVGTTVMPGALPVSGIDALLDEGRARIADAATVAALEAYADRFAAYVEAFSRAAVAA